MHHFKDYKDMVKFLELLDVLPTEFASKLKRVAIAEFFKQNLKTGLCKNEN